MLGIMSWGSYIPLWRLDRKAISNNLRGEKAIAGFDEDSITMAVAAAMDCLKGFDSQKVDALFFCTTTSPYKEKLGAAIVATAIDLRKDIITADFSNSLRAGTTALKVAIDGVKSGSLGRVLVVSSDCRLGAPGSNWEINCGDGAAAFLIGTSEVIAEIEAFYSIFDEMMDIWRVEDDRFIRSSESRFVLHEGFARVSREAITGLMRSFNLKEKDFNKAIFALSDPRAQIALAKSIGFDIKTQLQDSLFNWIGETGAAYSLMLLEAALEDAKENDKFLLLSYGNGSDAMSVRVFKDFEKRHKNRSFKKYIESKKVIEDYKTYARWRELLPFVKPPHPLGLASPAALWRELEQNIRLYGVKCKTCGTVQYPIQEICTKCHGKGKFEKVRFSDKRGKLFTYSVDYISWAPEMPSVTAIVNFEGGGRIQSLMADTKIDEIKIDMPVEMSFRKMDFREGINLYSWKCVPIRN
jgi:3-hydroxy-3-methylglutaryl CoA synthase